MPTNKILCIGEALIDMICTDKNTSLPQGQHFLKKPGGAPANVAAAIASLGGSVDLVAKVGKDPFGKQLVDVMNDFGVSAKWMLQDDHFTTMAFVSLMEEGERDFVFNRGADRYLSKEDVNDIDLDEFSIVHFGSATAFLPGLLQETYTEIFQKATARGIFTSFDPNYRQMLFKNNEQTFIDQSWDFLNGADFFKVSDEEALLITGCSDVNDAANTFSQKTNAVYTITLGKKGALLGAKETIEIVTSIAANVVDTTGAGDAFVGAVLCQLQKKSRAEIKDLSFNDWKRIVLNGNKVAARVCEHLGAMEAFKYLDHTIFQFVD